MIEDSFDAFSKNIPCYQGVQSFLTSRSVLGASEGGRARQRDAEIQSNDMYVSIFA